MITLLYYVSTNNTSFLFITLNIVQKLFSALNTILVTAYCLYYVILYFVTDITKSFCFIHYILLINLLLHPF